MRRLLLLLSVALIRAQVSFPRAESPSALDERAGVAGAKVRTDTTEAQRKDANIGSTVEAAPAVVAPSVTNAAPMADKRDADPTPAAEAEPASKPGAAEEEGAAHAEATTEVGAPSDGVAAEVDMGSQVDAPAPAERMAKAAAAGLRLGGYVDDIHAAVRGLRARERRRAGCMTLRCFGHGRLGWKSIWIRRSRSEEWSSRE